MNRSTTITGLDIGSSKVAAVAAEITNDGVFNITASATVPSRGVAKGIIFDLNEAVGAVSMVLSKLREKTLRKPSHIYVSVSSQALRGTKSKGMIPISLRGREITRADMVRCAEAAGTIHLPFDREIIHRIVHDFSIDDQPPVRNPIGLYASRLSCEIYIISSSINHIQNIYKCANNAGYDIKEVVFTGIADGAVLLDKNDMDEGALLLDMGASLTEATIFSEGALSDFDIIPIGAADIKGEFRDSIDFTSLLSRVSSKKQDFINAGGKIKSVIVSGGLTFSDGIVEFLEEKLSCPVKMGVARDIKGEISGIDSVRLATAIGLARYAYEKHERIALERKNIAQHISTKVIDIFNNYF